MDTRKYFQIEMAGVTDQILLDFRARIALNMIEKQGLLAGKDGPEDSQGRAKIIDLPVGELVDRALAIAESFVTRCEERGYIKPCGMTEEEAYLQRHILERIGWASKEIETK